MLKKIINGAAHLYQEIFVTYTPCPGAAPGDLAAHSEVPRYPPIDKGIEVVPVGAIVATQQALIDRIRRTAGLRPDEFAERYVPVIHNLARYAHLLPATPVGNHRGAGGLFRLALEMGFYSLQVAQASVFLNKGGVSAESRLKLHPRWVYATFIAGVCSELYRPVTNMVVTNHKGEKWPQLLSPLFEWAVSTSCKRYTVVWNSQDEVDVIAMHQATAGYIVNTIVPMTGMQYLNDFGSEIVSTLTTCITNTTPMGVPNQVAKIVKDIRKKVVERDLRANGERYGDFTVGTHLEPHLVDVMRKLVRKQGTWTANVKGSRVWYSNEGLFIIWEPGAQDILEALRDAEHGGVPSEPDTLADILLTSGIAEQNDHDGRYWDICVPVVSRIFPALKISRPELLFEDPDEVERITDPILVSNLNQPRAAPARAAKKEAAKKAAGGPSATSSEGTTGRTGQIGASSSDVVGIDAEGKSAEGDSAVAAEHLRTEEVPPAGAEAAPIAAEGAAMASQPKGSAPAAVRSHPEEKPGKVDRSVDGGKEQSDMAARLLGGLPKDSAEFLRAIIEDHQDGSSTGPVFSIANGVAISVDELSAHGQTSYQGLMKSLSDKSWLWCDPDKPLRKLHDAEFQGKKLKVIVVKTEIARAIGFTWKQPK